MTPELALDMAELSVTTLLVISTPLMMIALAVGLIIALFQALTSIQEMTITFVPKILLLFVAMVFLLPWMSDKLLAMSQEIFHQIGTIGTVQ